MREFGTKKDKKKSKDDFMEVPGREVKKKPTIKAGPTTEADAEESGATETANPHGFIAGDDDKNEDTGADIQFFESKKPSKEDDLLLSGASAGPLIPQQMFVGAGLAG